MDTFRDLPSDLYDEEINNRHGFCHECGTAISLEYHGQCWECIPDPVKLYGEFFCSKQCVKTYRKVKCITKYTTLFACKQRSKKLSARADWKTAKDYLTGKGPIWRQIRLHIAMMRRFKVASGG